MDDRNRRSNEFASKHDDTMHAIRSRYPLGGGVDVIVMTAPDHSWTRMQLDTEHQSRDTSVQAGYAIWAPTYDQQRNPLIAVEGPRVDALVSSMPLTTAVDVGTGTGRHALSLARRGIKGPIA